MTMKRYSEVLRYSSFEDRFKYLALHGQVGKTTFDAHRYLNQEFYRSPEWKRLRNSIIIRDDGCDLAVAGYSLPRRLYVHHLNPITIEDILERNPKVTDPENLIVVSFDTHQAIHYGDPKMLPHHIFVDRKPNDTTPWKR